MIQRVLVVNRRAPLACGRARASLDFLLAGAAMDLRMGVLFMDDGVYQLLAGQDLSAQGEPDFSRSFRVLPDYDVESVFVDAESLRQRGIDASQLLLDVDTVESDGIRDLFADYDWVVQF
jgi:tRNA 2-thiouridine synthesizing protein C